MGIQESFQHMGYNFHLTNQSVPNEKITHYKRIKKNHVKGPHESDPRTITAALAGLDSKDQVLASS